QRSNARGDLPRAARARETAHPEVPAMKTETAARKLAPATMCVHSARESGLVPPIVRSSTFRLDDDVYAQRASGGTERSRCYTRETNPTIEAVEAHVAALEGAERALVFASGQ